MTKLKTLKDLKIKGKGKNRTDPFKLKYDLKQEAIKWVKSPEKSYYTTINWILHFFNITEEDLK